MNNDKMPNNKNNTDKVKDKVDIKKYTDPTGLSAQNLDFGLWLAGHKQKIIKIIIIILSTIAAFFIVYALYGYFYYFTFGREQERIMDETAANIDIAAYRAINTTKPLEVLAVKAISSGGNYDLVAKIKNPNPKHYASINYCFILGTDQKCGSSFVLPSEEKIIILPKQLTSEAVNNVSFKTDNINWQKLNAHYIPDWEIYKKDHLNFTVRDVKSSTYGNNLNYLEFNVSNDSAYSYYEVPFNIVIRSGDNIIAINRYIVADFNSRENRNVRLYWPEINSYGDTIDIIPDLNITNDNIYKPYSN